MIHYPPELADSIASLARRLAKYGRPPEEAREYVERVVRDLRSGPTPEAKAWFLRTPAQRAGSPLPPTIHPRSTLADLLEGLLADLAKHGAPNAEAREHVESVIEDLRCEPSAEDKATFARTTARVKREQATAAMPNN